MGKTDKEYQHYVPKFYLRLFSKTKNSIGAYIFKQDKYIPIASLSSIGESKYLYGEDGEIEDWFSELDGKWNNIFKKIINNNSLNIDLEEYSYILMFVFLSEARSKTNADTMNKFINELAITTHNIDPKNKEKYSYKDNIAHFTIPNLHTIETMPNIVPTMFDLNMVLIINQTSTQFITSDCIVNKYNQFLLEKSYKRGYAYGTCGIEIFVPLSPNHCLCLYDSSIYETKQKNNIIIIKDVKEINKLNKLFLYNSDKNIFFNSGFEKGKLDVLLKNTNRLVEDESTLFKSKDGEFLIKFASRYIDKNFDLGFIKTRKAAKKVKVNLNSSAPVRPYVEVLRSKDKDETPKEVMQKIEGKKFYLEKKI